MTLGTIFVDPPRNLFMDFRLLWNFREIISPNDTTNVIYKPLYKSQIKAFDVSAS